MTQQTFRRIVLGMSDAVEGAHMNHPDFRVKGRIFATLRPDHNSGVVMLTPEQQQRMLREAPESFSAESGAWGRQGCTRVHLDVADEELVGEAITLAWQNAVAAPRKSKTKPGARSGRRGSSKRA